MPIIHTLSRQEAQKIAAGEVVERPASVAKELLENSFDAGATVITLSIADGGRTRIACSDNGCGMDAIDARTCIQTHATSKIRSLDDLFTLNTFGFRGEALASLAAVSNVHIITKTAVDVHATHIQVEHGTIVHESIEARDTGTTISVEQLFKTVPARLKFLKKDETEQRHIIQLFDALCLAQPAVHAKLIIDGTIHANYPATADYAERAQQIISHRTYAQLIPVNYTHKGIHIEGAISTHQTQRYDKSGIYFFVNRRFVKNLALFRAVMRAYTVLPEGKFPLVSLHITIDPAVIDVNIHPRKEEIAFANSIIVEQAITEALKQTLDLELSRQVSAHTLNVEKSREKSESESVIKTHIQSNAPATTPFAFAPNTVPIFQEKVTPAAQPITNKNYLIPENTAEQSMAASAGSTVIMQLDATYIVTTTEQGLTLVDQHAAHERILYEQFASRFGSIETVQLLFPELVTLPPTDYDLVLAYQELLQGHGIIAEPFGNNCFRVTALPVFAKHISAEQMLMELATTFHDMPVKADAHLFLTHALRAQMACKAAVKAGDTLTTVHMQQLLKDLEKAPNKLTCPHGRPTYWTITIKELEKKFQRTL